MPKKDLRSSLTSQLNSAARREETAQENFDDNGVLTAFTGATADLGAERKAATMLSGGYAYDLDEVVWIPVDLVHDNPYQPRTAGMGDVGQLQDLIDSINKYGIEQIIVARPHPDERLHPNEFQQVFGHRRKYAVKLGGANAGTGRPDARNLIGHLPCLIRRGISDEDMLARAIDENEVREDVIAIDRARGNRALRVMVSNAMADEGLIKRVTIGGKMQLARLASYREMEERKGTKYRQFARVDAINDLPDDILKAFDEAGNWGFLKIAHGTALLILQDYPKDQKRLLNDAVKNGWSGAETAATAKERLDQIRASHSQQTIFTEDDKLLAEQKRRDTEAANAQNRAALQAGTSHLSSVPPVEAQKGPKFAIGDSVKWIGKDGWKFGVVAYFLPYGRIDVRGKDGVVLTLEPGDLFRYNVKTEAPEIGFKAGDRVTWNSGEELFGVLVERFGDGEDYHYWSVTDERDGGKTFVYESKMSAAPKVENSSRSIEIPVPSAPAKFETGDRVIVTGKTHELQGTITGQGTLNLQTWFVEFEENRGNAIVDESDIRLAEPVEDAQAIAESEDYDFSAPKSNSGLLIDSLASESDNEALIRKARTFLDAAKNELEQVKDVDDRAREEIELAIDTCRTVLDVLKNLHPSGEKFISQL